MPGGSAACSEGALLGWLLRRAPSVPRLPVGLMSADEVAAELQRVQARKAMDAAYEAELVLALAAARPDCDDPPPGHPGARRRGAGSPVPGTSEFLPDELAMVLNCSRPFAASVLSDAYLLIERMRPVWAACGEGRLDWHRARVFADVLGPASDEVIAVVVPAVLPLAAGLSSGKLRNRLIAAAVAADEEFAERRRIEAERRAAVRLYPTGEGLSALTTELPSPVAAAMWSTIDQAAQLAKTSGDDRPIGVLRAEAHAALVLRPWDTSARRSPATSPSPRRCRRSARPPAGAPPGAAGGGSGGPRRPGRRRGLRAHRGRHPDHRRPPARAAGTARLPRRAGTRRRQPRAGPHRRRRRPARHRHPRRVGPPRRPRLPATPAGTAARAR